MAKDGLSRFNTLLQGGCRMQVRHGQAIGAFLKQLPGVTDEFIVNEIQTLFLNGTPIDDMKSPFTLNDTTLALSAAMPGLAGAIFRRNSLHAALRGKNASSESALEDDRPLFITLKLFNSVATSLGPHLFKQGVVFSGEQLHSFITDRPSIVSQLVSCTLNNQTIDPGALLPFLLEEEGFNLTIEETDDSSN